MLNYLIFILSKCLSSQSGREDTETGGERREMKEIREGVKEWLGGDRRGVGWTGEQCDTGDREGRGETCKDINGAGEV